MHVHARACVCVCVCVNGFQLAIDSSGGILLAVFFVFVSQSDGDSDLSTLYLIDVSFVM